MGPPPEAMLVPVFLLGLAALTAVGAVLLVASLAGYENPTVNKAVGVLLALLGGAAFVGGVEYGFEYVPSAYVVLAVPVAIGGFLVSR